MDRISIDSELTIQEVSDRLGLPKSTLRYWEKELGEFIRPKRTPGGQRRYDMENIYLFQRVRELKNRGLSLSEIELTLKNSFNQKAAMNPLHDSSIEFLARRIAALVKLEVSNYLSGGKRL
jgi:DNA-binding transcriptional MerR regulator